MGPPVLLEHVLWMKASYAEQEGRFADALYLTKKKHEHSVEFQNERAGFVLRDYYNKIEKNQLEAEAKNKELELEVKSNQLRSSVYAIVFVALLAAIILYGLYKQRQSKLQISAQYDLIQLQSDQLKQLDAAKSRFFANVSHELRTPLTLMLGPVKTLLKGHHSPQNQERLLNMALNSGKLLQHLVNEILNLRKLEMGKMELFEKPTKLHAYFIRYASQFESLVAIRRIDFTIKANVGRDVTVVLDREKCWQLIHNLLSNAFKFTPEGGSVQARLSLTGNMLTLEVADTGIGILPEDLPRVFDRFFQTTGREGWDEAQGGTGIGLALCQEYAQLFGGKMEVESPDPISGKGSVFRAVFPVKLVEDKEEVETEISAAHVLVAKPEKDPAETPPTDKRPNILVMEDNLELQEYLRFVLEDRYQVITTGNGQEALAVLNGELKIENGELKQASQFSILNSPFSIDLIISDLMIPVMNGYQLLQKLKSDDATRHIPFIMLTARAGKDDRLKALRIGVDDYLTKPFDEEELLVRIANLLANRAVREQMNREEGQPEDGPILSKPDEEWIENFEAYVIEHLASDILSISNLAHEFAMSESTLLRQLKRLTGLTPQQYLQEARLLKALQLLEDRSYSSISRIASEVGYANIQSFSKGFKQRFGKSPSEMLTD